MNLFDPNQQGLSSESLAFEEPDATLEEEQEDNDAIPSRFSIAVSRADFDIDGLVRRLKKEDIYIPEFQRSYVWQPKQASRFIESLLLGLPVPGIFLVKEQDKRMIVIDGQQRLRSLLYFYEGRFPDRRQRFSLKGVLPEFEGKSYESLTEDYRR